jgi:hypothetical protein
MRSDESRLLEWPRAEDLMAIASARSGLDDLGEPDRNTGLGIYLTPMAEEAWPRMTGHARALAVDYLTHQLEARLSLDSDNMAPEHWVCRERSSPQRTPVKLPARRWALMVAVARDVSIADAGGRCAGRRDDKSMFCTNFYQRSSSFPDPEL